MLNNRPNTTVEEPFYKYQRFRATGIYKITFILEINIFVVFYINKPRLIVVEMCCLQLHESLCLRKESSQQARRIFFIYFCYLICCYFMINCLLLVFIRFLMHLRMNNTNNIYIIQFFSTLKSVLTENRIFISNIALYITYVWFHLRRNWWN